MVTPPPSSGRLSADTHFTINLNDGTRFKITVLQSETSGFSQLAQLVFLPGLASLETTPAASLRGRRIST